MRSRNLHGWSAFEEWLQEKFNMNDWQWVMAVIITIIVIALMLSTAIHIL